MQSIAVAARTTGSRVLQICTSGTFTGRNLTDETCAFLDMQAAAIDIATDIRPVCQCDFAFTENVASELPKNDNCGRIDVAFHSSVFTDRQMLLVVRHSALEKSVNYQAFCR